ncbi:transient receptor potential cation channel subfamily M member 2-like [Clytia hemisphaerica]
MINKKANDGEQHTANIPMTKFVSCEDSDTDYEDAPNSNPVNFFERFKIYGDVALAISNGKRISRDSKDGEEEDEKKTVEQIEPSLVNTNAYGQLEFLKASRKTIAKFLRLADTTDTSDVVHLFSKKWDLRLSELQLLISVVGGYDTHVKLSPEIQSSLTQSFRWIAETMKPWIITCGIDCGVHKLVGDILQGHKYNETVLLGIANWDIVNGRESLATNDEQTAIKYPVVHPIDQKMVKEKSQADEILLNKDHSYFLLVDFPKGHEHKANQFRSQLENKLVAVQQVVTRPLADPHRCAQTDCYSEETFKPAIQIMVNGGPESIEIASLNLEMKTMPLILVADTGGAADLLCKACQLYDEHDTEDIASMAKIFQEEIKKTFLDYSDDSQKVLKQLLKCAKFKSSITIFHANQNLSLDQVILEVLLKRPEPAPSKSFDGLKVDRKFFQQLELASTWKRADVAKRKLFKGGIGFTHHPKELEDFLCEEMHKNRVATVELLLDTGFDIKVIDYNQLGYLYFKRYEMEYKGLVKKEKVWLKLFLDDEKVKEFQNELDRDQMAVDEQRRNYSRKAGKKTEYIHLKLIQQALIDLCGIDLFPYDALKSYAPLQKLVYPFGELFLWAVFCNMHQMAVMLWRRGDEVLARALMARKIYREMKRGCRHKFSSVDEALLQQLEANENEFSELALGILKNCDISDKEATKELLFKPVYDKTDLTCWTLATSSNFQEFMEHPVCQSIVMERWCGELQLQGSYITVWVIGAIFFPPLVFKLPYYESKKTKCIEDELCKSQKRSVLQRIHSSLYHSRISMFHRAPITKFFTNLMSFLVFLGLFIFVLQSKFKEKPSTSEWVLVAYVVSFTTEELRQIVYSKGMNARQLLRSWWKQAWNKMDLVAILLFYTALGFRLSGNKQIIEIGRVLYTLDLMVWILRLLDFFSVNKKLGTYVVMIKKMTADVLNFVVIFFVFWLSYALARSFILERSESFTFNDLRHFIIPYFEMYGEMFVSPMEANANTTMFGTPKYHSYHEAMVAVIMVIYLLFTNLLLVNLLIALFNNTYASVQTNSNRVWKWQWYLLVEGYIERPILVPPFIVISHIYQFVCFMVKKCCTPTIKKKRASKKKKKNYAGQFNRQFSLKSFLLDTNGYFDEKERHDKERQKYQLKMFRLMKFEEECQQTYLANLCALTPQERKLDQIIERTNQLENVLLKTLDKVLEMDKRLNSLDQIRSRLQRLQFGPVEQIRQTPKDRRTPEKKSFDYRRMHSNMSDVANRHASASRSMSLQADAMFLGKKNSLVPTNSNPLRETAINNERNRKSNELDEIYSQVGSLNAKTEEQVPEAEEDNRPAVEGDIYEQPATLVQRRSLKDIKLDIPPEIDHFNPPKEDKFIHVLSRSMKYPFTDIRRFYFPDSMVDWKVEFPAYSPKPYTSIVVDALEDHGKEEEDPRKLSFNALDGQIDRRSFCGIYDVVSGYPRNPIGRTGISGRGCLKLFGPNHIIELIITRRKNVSLETTNDEREYFEVLVVRNDSADDQYKLPSGEHIGKRPFISRLQKLLCNETLSQLGMGAKEIVRNHATATSVFLEKNERKIYEGYMDDERNTDNAWLETSVRHFHDDADALKKFFLNEKAVDNLKLCWILMHEGAHLPDHQLFYLQEVVSHCKVSFDALPETVYDYI